MPRVAVWDDSDDMTPQKMEIILRHWADFRELYEATGVDELQLGKKIIVNIHDILQDIVLLPKRQREAIQLTCLQGLREIDAAKIMGLAGRSSPVGAYKRLGLKKLASRWH